MKKISILAALLVMLTMTFTSCKEDTQPRLDYPTEFVLNRPAYADQLVLVEENGFIRFTCSQANYGLATTPTYQLQVSKTEDFAEYQTVDYTTTKADMVIPAEPFAMAVCSLYGWTVASEADQSVPVWVRCISSVPKASDKYTIASNAVKLEQVKVYFAVKLPDAIYLIGQPSGWDINSAAMPLYETEIGSKVYKGTYTIEAGQFQFRFYDELGDWNFYSIGAQDADSPVGITFTDGEYAGQCFYDPETESAGKGGWECTSWGGGDVEMTVNLNNKTVVFRAL